MCMTCVVHVCEAEKNEREREREGRGVLMCTSTCPAIIVEPETRVAATGVAACSVDTPLLAVPIVCHTLIDICTGAKPIDSKLYPSTHK